MTDPAVIQFAVGQRVWVYDVNAKRGDAPKEGTVTKVGRSLVHVQHEWSYGGKPQTFRMDDGQANDNYSHQWIRTDEERVRHDRWNAAVKVLAEHRLMIDHGAKITLEQVEALAAVFA